MESEPRLPTALPSLGNENDGPQPPDKSDCSDTVPDPPAHSYLSRDQRIQAAALYKNSNLSLRETATALGFSLQQVRTAVKRPATPQKRKGRPSKLSTEQVEYLIEFVSASSDNSRLSYKQLAEKLPFDCSEWSIRTALWKQGFHRGVGGRKPRITESTTTQQTKKTT